MPTNSDNKISTIFDMAKRLIGLYIENVRLTSAEKLSVLFSSIALFSIVIVIAMIAMIFIAIGLASMLESYIAPFWSYFIISGILFVVILLLFIFKAQLFINPIARFVSKLLLDSPKKEK